MIQRGIVVFFLVTLLALIFSIHHKVYYPLIVILTLSLVIIFTLFISNDGRYKIDNTSTINKWGSECFMIDQAGLCDFDNPQDFQLLAQSRISFLGCWLALQPTYKTENLKTVYSKPKSLKIKYCFIFKDSLSATDFSNLCCVIKLKRLEGLTQ